MKKNSRNLDYLIGSIWHHHKDNESRHIKMVVNIEYDETEKSNHTKIVFVTMNGPWTGNTISLIDNNFFNYYKEIK